jgi:type III secretion protein Q
MSFERPSIDRHVNTPQTSNDLQVQPLNGLLPGVAAFDAGVSRVLRDRRLARLLGDDATLDIACTQGQALPDVPLYRVRAQCADGPLEILLCAPGLGSLAVAASEDTPPSLRPLVAEAALAPCAEAAQRCGIEGFCVQRVDEEALDASARARPWYHVQQQGDAVAWFSCVQAPRATLLALPNVLARQRPPPSAWSAHLPLRGRVRLCEQALAWSVVRRLACGDVLLTQLPPTAFEQALPVRVHWGVSGERVWGAAATLTMQQLSFSGGANMDAQDTEELPAALTTDPATTDPAIAELELPVHFELDTVAMPLAALQSLQPGYVLEMPTPLHEATVRLVACGQTIAHAELVAVGERIGARITRLLLQDDHARPEPR